VYDNSAIASLAHQTRRGGSYLARQVGEKAVAVAASCATGSGL